VNDCFITRLNHQTRLHLLEGHCLWCHQCDSGRLKVMRLLPHLPNKHAQVVWRVETCPRSFPRPARCTLRTCGKDTAALGATSVTAAA
jgi:hypothetical protein